MNDRRHFYTEELEAVVELLKRLNENSSAGALDFETPLKVLSFAHSTDGDLVGWLDDEIGGTWSFVPVAEMPKE